ncbi:MAG: RtcB family protein, partial [Phycisphaeraceae bacterium]|nr:RtcB family protein [Phycisphaeraceae bacterium]
AAVEIAKDAGLERATLEAQLQEVVAEPARFIQDSRYGPLAQALQRVPPPPPERQEPAPWRQWGQDLDHNALEQMRNACRLPVSVAGALMPDAHVGYGLPIGGVLATAGSVIPYAVGVDIACRMRISVLDVPVSALEQEQPWLIGALERETRFGVGATFKKPHDHEAMHLDWDVTRVTRGLKDKARTQLGTSGSGNHFVEFGILSVPEGELGLKEGKYLALMSHSGSRGSGAEVASYYSRRARELHPSLPPELKHLAWLDLDSEDGQEYWAAMELMGHYAAANHAVIHREVVRHLQAGVLAAVENHHNFAWKEAHTLPDGTREELVVHRKGATPAGAGVLGVIPGSMATPGFVVVGRGSEASLKSASHGAGRVMSRTKAKQSFAWGNVKRELAAAGVRVMSAGLDEVPGVYKDIHKVMAQQRDLVDVIGRFDPRLVKMSPEGERAED